MNSQPVRPAQIITTDGEALSGAHTVTEVADAVTRAAYTSRVELPADAADQTVYAAGFLGVRKAALAIPALLTYTATTRGEGESIETVIRDLLSDLSHLADLFATDENCEDIDPNVARIIDLFDQAHSSYARERDGDL